MDEGEVIQTVRACLLSAKGGVKFDDLNPDYRMIIGENIPFRRLGYPSLEAFLRTIHGLKISNKLGVWYAEVLPTEDTVHISKLISRQRSPKKTAKKSGKSSRYYAPFQQPNRAPTRSFRVTRGIRDNVSSAINRGQIMMKDGMDYRMGKENGIPSLMAFSVKNLAPHQTDRPRYIQSAGITSSPSKRLKDRLASSPTNVSPVKIYPPPAKISEGIDKTAVVTSVINQKPKTVVQGNTIVYKGKVDINERLKINPHASPHTPAQNNYQPTIDMSYAKAVSPPPPTSQSVLRSTPPSLMANATRTSFDTPKRTVPKQSTQDPREQLKVRAKNLGLPEPVYKILPTRNSSNDATVFAKVKVGTYETSSYPAEAKTSDEAEILAANLAIKDLIEKYGSAGDFSETTNHEAIKTRVLALVDKYPNGVFMQQIVLCYMQEYKEKLPSNWVKVIETYSAITLEKGADNSVILRRYVPQTPKPPKPAEPAKPAQSPKPAEPAKPAQSPKSVQPTQPAQSAQSPKLVQPVQSPKLVQSAQSPKLVQPAQSPKLVQSAQSPKLVQSALSPKLVQPAQPPKLVQPAQPPKPSDVSLPKVDKIQLNPIGPAAPEQLKPPNEDFWMVYVTLVAGTTDIWAKLIGENYSDKFDEMTREMTEFYSKGNVQPATAQSITVGHYYTVFDDDFWHRVLCVDFDAATGVATVSFIDYGDEDTFQFSKLYTLDKRFSTVSAQAIRLCLDGLEVFDDCEKVVSRAKALLCDLSFYVEVVNYDSNEEDPFATVVFYDSRGPEDINVNKLLTKEVLRDIALPPKLDVIGLVTKVFMSHVEDNGDIFVQVQSESMSYLVKLLNRLTHACVNTNDLSRSVVQVIDTAKLYFVHSDDSWYRGKVVQIVGNKVKMFLLDFGKTVTVGKASLLHLDMLSPILTKYPAQALKAHLHNIDSSMFNDKMVAKLNDLAPRSEPLLAKIVAMGKDSAATLELFKRIQPSNMLVSINTTLVYEEKLTGTNGDGNNNVKPRKRLDRMSSRNSGGGNDENELIKVLKPPNIPGIGEFFDVHVTMAANPGNFTVQPFDNQIALEEMMILLQDTCEKYDGPQPTPESVKESQLYAGKHNDGHWYRVYVSNVISDNMVTVYFCDYGDVCVLTLTKLQPLKKQFLELPYQAIRAKIIGIQPTNIDWSVEDCIRFQEIVVDRDFVSTIVECGSDKLSPAESMLGVRLISVDTAEDVYVDEILVNEGRAIFTKS